MSDLNREISGSGFKYDEENRFPQRRKGARNPQNKVKLNTFASLRLCGNPLSFH